MPEQHMHARIAATFQRPAATFLEYRLMNSEAVVGAVLRDDPSLSEEDVQTVVDMMAYNVSQGVVVANDAIDRLVLRHMIDGNQAILMRHGMMDDTSWHAMAACASRLHSQLLSKGLDLAPLEGVWNA